MTWRDDLRYDPVKPLIESGHTAIEYWTRKIILNEAVATPEKALWGLKIPASILRKQKADGAWTYPAKRTSPSVDYDLLETYRELGFLVEMYGFTDKHPGIAKAAEYILQHQTSAGDLRGIYAQQYSPNYTAAMLELLVKCGYSDDPRITKTYSWLSDSRQHDGGWALAFRTNGRNLDAIYTNDAIIEPDRSKPFSHFVTGVVLRAYAAHPAYRKSAEAQSAAPLLLSRFFEKDVYPDRNRRDDWIRFSFPFWQTDLLSSLDSIGLIDPTLIRSPKVQEAKQWFIEHQQSDGLFTGHLLKDRYHDLQLWYSYAVCRALRRFST